MRSRIHLSLFATAIAVSAAAHGLALVTFKSVRLGAVKPEPRFSEMAVVYDDPQTDAGRPGSEFEIGRPDAKGYATHEVAGRREQTAREAPQDQPSLSLDPVGNSRLVEVPSAPANASQARSPVAPAPPPTVVSERVAPPMPLLPPDAQAAVRRDRIETVLPAPPSGLAPPEHGDLGLAFAPPVVDPPAPEPQPRPVPAPAAVPSPDSGSGADSAPQGDSEADAFSVLGSVQFRAGRVTVQSGRQVKTRRPKIGLAGLVELAQRNTAQVELDVTVDRAGTVTNVEIARSSGSNNIDQPCRVAMYDWWFEPKKDATGRPVPDRFRFTIAFR